MRIVFILIATLVIVKFAVMKKMTRFVDSKQKALVVIQMIKHM
jgi:hypothetical protein